MIEFLKGPLRRSRQEQQHRQPASHGEREKMPLWTMRGTCRNFLEVQDSAWSEDDRGLAMWFWGGGGGGGGSHVMTSHSGAIQRVTLFREDLADQHCRSCT